MSPSDVAWRLLKMPLLPESVRHVGFSGEDKGYWPVKTGEPMDIAMQLLKESVQTKLPGYDNPRPAASIRRRHNRRSEGRAQPARLHVKGNHFSLLDDDDNVLSQLERDSIYGEVGSQDIRGQYGYTPKKNRDKGYYTDLMEAALRHGYKIRSNSRNSQSNPLHEKFLTNLPSDITAETEAIGPGHLNYHDYIDYEGKYSPGNAIGWGDLQTDSRSKVPMTYETDYQRYQDRLNRGIAPNTDIQVKEGDGMKNYVQSRLDLSIEGVPRWGGMMPANRSGGEGWHGDGRVPMIPTNQGIGVPTGLSHELPFHQINKPFHDINFAPSLQAGAVGINPQRLTIDQHNQQQS